MVEKLRAGPSMGLCGCQDDPMGDDTVVNGVFEGGGAKGLAYVGALQACDDAGLTFGAVSGSSAGAITALLVACGYSPEDTKDKMKEALSCLGGQGWASLALTRRSLLSSKALRTWLTRTVADRIKPDLPVSARRTFADVRQQSQISLYVITMDLAAKQPLVFSPDLTPDADVVEAVIASAAIPVAFPAQRVGIDGEFRRIADGGSWANYPSFVFLDEDFRRSHVLRDGAEGRRVVGFLLDSVHPTRVETPTSGIEAAPERGLSTDRGAAEREMRLFGGLVTSPIVRGAVLALPPLMIVIGFTWFPRELDEGLPTVALMPDGLEDLSLLLLVLLYTFLVVYAVVLALMALRFSRSLVDEGVVAATAALGVGPNVPYWVGAPPVASAGERERYVGEVPRHLPIRLLVPPELKTLTSKPGEVLTEQTLAVGRDTTARALAGASGVAESPEAIAVDAGKPRWSPPPWLSLIVFWVGFYLSLRLAFEIVEAADDSDVAWWQLVALFAVGTVLLAFHGLVRMRYASGARSWLREQRSVALIGLAATAGLVGAGISMLVLFDDASARELSTRERLQAEPVDGWALEVVSTKDAFEIALEVTNPEVLTTYQGVDGVEAFIDLYGDEVVPCSEDDGDFSCLVLLTDLEFAEGDPMDLWYDRDEGVIFLDEDRWEFAGESAFLPVLAAALLVFGYRSWRAFRWRRQHGQR